jgi:hypothetical protein
MDLSHPDAMGSVPVRTRATRFTIAGLLVLLKQQESDRNEIIKAVGYGLRLDESGQSCGQLWRKNGN